MSLDEGALREGADAMGVMLSDRQCADLLAYGALILKWNRVYNLTALRDEAGVMTHHLLDSLSILAPLARQCLDCRSLLDVGSGAGLPGVVVAILRPEIEVCCLDAVAKKTAFIQQVAAELKLPNLRGLHARVEATPGRFDVVASRAFASLSDFFAGSAQLLDRDSCWLAMKGRVPNDELQQLPKSVVVFHVEPLTVPGLDAERCIVWARKAAVHDGVDDGVA